MPFSRDPDSLGSKLGPKVIAAVTQSVIATKKGLMPTEHKLRVGAMQEIIDRAGHEIAELQRPMLAEILRAGGDKVNPIAREFLERTSSGRDQWQAIAGTLMGVSSGAISQLLSNYLADPIRALISELPSLAPDMGSITKLYTTGWLDLDTAQYNSRGQGYSDDWFDLLYRLSQSWPDIQSVLEFWRRGLIDWSDAQGFLTRIGVPTELFEYYEGIRQNVLSVSDAALGVLRTDLTLAQGRQIATANGYSDDDFNTLIDNTGEPLGLEQMLMAYRRGYITEDQLKLGIAQSRVRNEWTDTAIALRYSPASSADAIQAVVQGYLSESDARTVLDQNGVDPSAFDWLLKTAGEPLSRTEMADLVNRGLATEDDYKLALEESRLKDSYINLSVNLIKHPPTQEVAVAGYVQNYLSEDEANDLLGKTGLDSQYYDLVKEIAGIPLSLTEVFRLYRYGEMTKDEVEQALRESRLKDKYIDVAFGLNVQYPSIYDVRLMLEEAAITEAMATEILQKEGYPDDLVKALVKTFAMSGSTTSKTVTEGMLSDLYLEGAIDQTEFISSLKSLGYSDANAQLILEVNEWKAELSARNSLISRTRTLYVSNKITEQEAQNRLTVALVPSGVIDRVMADWNAELELNVKELTAAQIVDAWKYALFNPDDLPTNTTAAVDRLVQLGYDSGDALLLLQITNKGPTGGFFGGNTTGGQANTSSAKS
jgi:hypothetical protein